MNLLIQRVGHPIKHRKERDKRAQISYLIWCVRNDAKQRGQHIPSIEDAAGIVINKLAIPYTEDVLKKDYVSLKADEVFNDMAEIITEFNSKKFK